MQERRWRGASAPFAEKQKERKKLVLALLKFGFSYGEVLSMSEIEAEGYLEAYMEIVEPVKTKTYKVSKRSRK